MVEDGAFNHKIDYVTILKEILNLKGHPNCITGSKFMTILLNLWILPIGGASAVKGLCQSLRRRLVLFNNSAKSSFFYLKIFFSKKIG